MHVTTTPMHISRMYKNRSQEDKKRSLDLLHTDTRIVRKKLQLNPYFHYQLGEVYNERRSTMPTFPISASARNSEIKPLTSFENSVNLISSIGLKLLGMLFAGRGKPIFKTMNDINDK